MERIYINGARMLLRSRYFPKEFRLKAKHKYTAIIGLGGNIGNTARLFDRFLNLILKDRRFAIMQSSPMLVNKAFGYASRDYINAVIILKTSLYAKEILKIMQHFEKRFKRVREFRNSPRTLDLDILYFSAKSYNDNVLTLPHPGANIRPSVFIPLGLMKGV
ncbi:MULTISPECIES: 2-amino-4-hydroxy-6-hydroxymethyldihydropteridine diphosphokinase [Campylobacter]|uniref:2-amino-4-hydroxy-6-hydroxymethyldihydropteridine pyrophosphokinase n=1 Tax=Campylobacter porcelli TaxID=1660073 RepID=A0A1X9SY35_9BACT|nr:MULTISPECIES: 2-amino-4-hydroxy-6-hydroxymethyldihydropteridine diphosphokinase [unclassified Campylobacter]ARR01170.1 6-hydroxymethyl-7,8-dihydropterin pyrophosphokinase [Campylobacter sp. RM6137]MCR8679818.1 2-amino-4-hydroxy-6-hydroxymethyldihydropteridine diphosphokinase [Campylobacter sp. RM19072]MCR8695991.1 2-amino-4-hydroxy-6-hydroxymethyldihydropteridine diphosphokinase [Campylobacter sp. RM19073]MEE3744727.1 2-amino-4-hydroxy-6-hydroxymethyldihydropteridine diphosphokinase [Campylo